jgi:hypothetical protein
MKRFLLTLAVFLVPVALVFAMLFHVDGYTDPFYLRFTTPKQTSLVLGSSRAAQGILPEVINKILGRKDIYNYAFTIAHSPYGPTYLESITKKLDEHSANGIFILTVDPWSVSSTGSLPNDSLDFIERRLALGTTKSVTSRPNFLYLFHSYDMPLADLFKKNENTGMFLHDDGWLEVTVPMDSISVAGRTNVKISDYRKNYLPKYKFSQTRWRYLLLTIQYLQQHGRVFLVRMPVHDSIFEMENQLMPDFSKKIAELGKITHTPFLDLTGENDRCEYVDGNHLYKVSGSAVSAEIANWIKNSNSPAHE